MTATAVGPSWASLSDADQKALIDAFSRMTIANYAKNFDSYRRREIHRRAGVDRARQRPFRQKHAEDRPSEAIAFNYRLHQVGSDWKIVDVYLAGNISQMAQKRSDFAATLAVRRAAGPGEADQRAGGSDC